jgi:UTP--glucose-1-phosphate uridylyltransferase
MGKVNYAIIPASGRGIRFRPITKILSKEVLPLNGIPAIQYSVMECMNANINKIAILVRPDDDLIRQYFLSQPQFKDFVVTKFSETADKKELFISECDLPQMGNAMPILAMKDYIQNNRFAVLFPDDIIFGTNPIADLIETINSHPDCASTLLYTEIDESEIHNYGNIGMIPDADTITQIIQKPKSGYISNRVLISRIITDSRIFPYLDLLHPEKDLGKALNLQCQEQAVIGCRLSGEWVSIDSPIKYAHAVTVALKYQNVWTSQVIV